MHTSISMSSPMPFPLPPLPTINKLRPGRRRYMSKAQRACDLCRSRKTACRVEGPGPCRFCSMHGKECSYTESSSRHKDPDQRNSGLQNGSRSVEEQTITIPHLGASPALTSRTPQDSRDHLAEQFPEHLNLSHGMMNNESIGINGLTGSELLDIVDDDNHHENLIYDPGDEEFHQFFEEVARDLQRQSMNHDTDPTAILVGASSDMEPNLLRYYIYDANNQVNLQKLTVRSLRNDDMPVHFLLYETDEFVEPSFQAKSGMISPTEEKRILEELVPHDVGRAFIDLFFKFIFPQFPVLSTTAPPDPSTAPTHLLASIYLVAEQFSSFDERLCLKALYEPPSTAALFQLAWMSLNNASRKSNLSTLQAALILLLSAPPTGIMLDGPFKWSLLGSTISMAQTLGIHLDPSEWKLPEWQITLRKRLAATLYGVDKWLALTLGWPPHITEDNWLITEQRQANFELSETELGDCVISIEFSKLTSIVSLIIQKLYSIRAIEALKSNLNQTIEIARPLLIDLNNWHGNLPASIRFNVGAPISAGVDNSATLELGYYIAKFAILRSLLRVFDKPAMDQSSFGSDNPEWTEAHQYCRAAAIECAASSVEYVSSLRSSHFQAFWAPWTRTGFALVSSICMLLIVTSRTRAEIEECGAILEKAKLVLRLQAKSFETMRYALLKVDSISWAGFSKVFGFNIDSNSTIQVPENMSGRELT